MTKTKRKKNASEDPTENPISMSPPPPSSPQRPSDPPKKIIIINADMGRDMQWEAFDISVTVFEHFSEDRTIAEEIKSEFDRIYGPTWHCIVGRNFGSFVTHKPNHFVYFYLERKAVLLFKYG
ncbi:uncharacterized protein [Cicer arietinum]|uniref:Dynein light chain n=1 Tax=Cicer arietinum TaxID=3827 RepID=A0A1S2XG59_CICAR|nr:dynein light chain LC6, flagellar outer arm-like [Cicer arietinum]